jgi:Leucine-rich repeat (LRR) protein
LDGNLLSDLSGLFTRLPNLVWLNVSDNRLSWFDYALVPSGLQWLDLHANRLTELGNHLELSGGQLKLSTLDASANRLTELAGSAIPDSVELLFLSDNLISKVNMIYIFFLFFLYMCFYKLFKYLLA